MHLAWALIFLWLGTALIILGHAIFNKRPHDGHHGLLSLYACVCLVNVITIALKTYAGRYRPDWLSTYAPSDSNEGRFSFP